MAENNNFLDLFESRFHEFGRRIALLDTLRDEIKRIDILLDSLSNKLNKLLDSDKIKSEESKKTSSELIGSLTSFEDKLNVISVKMENSKATNERRLSDLEDFKKNHFVLEAKHNDSEGKIANLSFSRDFLQNKIQEMGKIHEESEKHISTHHHDLISLKNEISNIFNKISIFQTEKESMLMDVLSLSSLCRKIEKDAQERNISLRTFCEKAFADISDSFEKRLKAVVIPDISGLADKKRVEDLSRTLDLAALDAKNAFQKSTNNEMQNSLLSKKLENVQIFLKSQEYGSAK